MGGGPSFAVLTKWPPALPSLIPESPPTLESGLAWQVGVGQGSSWTLEGAGAPPLQASCCQPSWTDCVETGGPETEINCQVSGAEWGACQPLCFLAGGRGGRKQLHALSQAVTPLCHLPSPPRCLHSHGSEARLSLEFGGLVDPVGPGAWVRPLGIKGDPQGPRQSFVAMGIVPMCSFLGLHPRETC